MAFESGISKVSLVVDDHYTTYHRSYKPRLSSEIYWSLFSVTMLSSPVPWEAGSLALLQTQARCKLALRSWCVCVCAHTRVLVPGWDQCNDTIVKYSRLKTPKVDFSFNSRWRDFRELILEMICRNGLSWEKFNCWGKLSNVSRGEADSVGLGQVVKDLSLVSWAFYSWFRQGNFTGQDRSGDITLVVTSRVKTNLREMMALLGHQVTCTVDWGL